MRSLAEWALALGACAGLIWAGLPLVRRLAPPVSPTVALVESVLPALPAGVPAGAEPVPMIMLLDGTILRVGMPESALTRLAVVRWLSGRPRTVPGVLGERLVLPFEADGTRFWVIVDRTEPAGERHVTAIYLR